jgi:hypothetical protein
MKTLVKNWRQRLGHTLWMQFKQHILSMFEFVPFSLQRAAWFYAKAALRQTA